MEVQPVKQAIVVTARNTNHILYAIVCKSSLQFIITFIEKHNKPLIFIILRAYMIFL